MHHAPRVSSSSVPPEIVKAAWSNRRALLAWVVPVAKLLGIVLGLGALWRGPQWVESRASNQDLDDVYLALESVEKRVGADARDVSSRWPKGRPAVEGGVLVKRVDELSQKQALWGKEQADREAAMLRSLVVLVAAHLEPARERKERASLRARKVFDDEVKDGVSAVRAFEKALELDQ